MADKQAWAINKPEWADGALVWSDELEAIYQAANKSGRAVAILQNDDGVRPVMLLGWLLSGEVRQWVVRMSLVLSATDFPASYAVNYQYGGEEPGQKMYPRRPFEIRRVGVLNSIDEVNPMVLDGLAEVDRLSEEIYQEAKDQTKASSAERLEALMRPRPWWKFW